MSPIIILVIVILLCSIVGGGVYWTSKEKDSTGGSTAAAEALAAADAAVLATSNAAAAEAAHQAAILAALGKSCSTQQDCISPLVCDEYAMKCAYSPVNPPFGDSGVNYTSLSQANRDAIGSGWKQIKYLPGTSTKWFPGHETWEYPGTEFLFTRGDFSAWLICDKFQAVGEFYNRTPRTITKSSISATPYTAIWFNRQNVQHYGHLDPVISLRDSEISQNEGTVMYIEDSHTAATSSIHSSGMYVFIR